MTKAREGVEAAPRRGRPPGSSPRAMELIALDLFRAQGVDDTTVEQIATRAGVSSRTFFRYFDSKLDVLWHRFDRDVEALRAALAEVPGDVPLMDAIRQVVVGANRYAPEHLPELRTRMDLLAREPALQASAAAHYLAWEQAISEFAARRLGEAPDGLVPLAVGRATLGACRAAFDTWAAAEDDPAVDPSAALDEALRALAAGFR